MIEGAAYIVKLTLQCYTPRPFTLSTLYYGDAMSIKNDIQALNNRIDTCRHKLEAAQKRADKAMIFQFEAEINKLSKQVASLTHKQKYDLNKERKALLDMPFSRAITKAEQADLGALKKKVKGIVVVHPLTKIGKALNLEEMTGFADKEF